MKNKEKFLDALKLKEKIQAKVLNETNGLGSIEEINYYREAAKDGPFADLFSRLEKKAKHVGKQANALF